MVIVNKKIFIDPKECFTKSAYARKIGVTPTYINDLIKLKKLIEVKIQGGCFVMEIK